MDTSVKIGNLLLKNPVTVASGTAGYGEELSKFFDISKIGAIFTKGLSIKPRPGNRGNRIIETPSGVLNSIGLENIGIEKFISEKIPFLKSLGATVIPNVAGHTEEENVELAAILSSTEGVDAIELNVSCPNVKEGGMAFGTNVCSFTSLVEKVRKASSCPLIVKLSPNVTDVTEFAIMAEKIGADAVSAVNTFLGMKIDIKTGRPYFNNRVAGLSGPAIRPLAVRIVYQIFEKVSIPIVGLGGISSVDDAIEFIMAGSTAISLGTINMVDPDMAISITHGIEKYLNEKKYDSISSLIGIAHRHC